MFAVSGVNNSHWITAHLWINLKTALSIAQQDTPQMWFLVAQACPTPCSAALEGLSETSLGLLDERLLAAISRVESCCAVGMAGFEGERISTPLSCRVVQAPARRS